MKTEILQKYAEFGALLNALSDDPLPAIPLPTGLTVIRTYGGPPDSPLSIEIGWDAIPSGLAASLDYMGAPGNAAGPQEWLGIPTNPSPGINGEYTTLVMQNPTGQSIILRLRWSRTVDSGFSEPVLLSFPVFE